MDNQFSTCSLESLLKKAGKLASPPLEETLFSIGGRGYYENPTSDLLAFFLRPDGEHGLGTLFMEALVDSMPPVKDFFPAFDGSLEHFTVEREKDTGGGGRIDFLMRGHDWVMLIENKIYHSQINPFEDYERFGNEVARGKPLHLVILSPSGKSEAGKWYGVSYEAYCAKLKARLGEFFIGASFSKWHLFAREFVLHIENELYAKSMNEEQIRLVEENQIEIAQLQKLKEDYRLFLTSQLRGIMSKFYDVGTIRIKDETWALRCRSEAWGQSDVAWWYSDPPKVEVKLSVYIETPSLEQTAKLNQYLESICPMDSWKESGGRWSCWKTESGFAHREDAEKIFAEMVKVMKTLYPQYEKPVEGKALEK